MQAELSKYTYDELFELIDSKKFYLCMPNGINSSLKQTMSAYTVIYTKYSFESVKEITNSLIFCEVPFLFTYYDELFVYNYDTNKFNYFYFGNDEEKSSYKWKCEFLSNCDERKISKFNLMGLI